jgi:hypothetical protein
MMLRRGALRELHQHVNSRAALAATKGKPPVASDWRLIAI